MGGKAEIVYTANGQRDREEGEEGGGEEGRERTSVKEQKRGRQRRGEQGSARKS